MWYLTILTPFQSNLFFNLSLIVYWYLASGTVYCVTFVFITLKCSLYVHIFFFNFIWFYFNFTWTFLPLSFRYSYHFFPSFFSPTPFTPSSSHFIFLCRFLLTTESIIFSSDSKSCHLISIDEKNDWNVGYYYSSDKFRKEEIYLNACRLKQIGDTFY